MDEELAYLTDDERAHFAKWSALFSSDGWKLLVEELSKELEDGPAQYFMTVKSYEDLLAARSRIQAVAQLASYERIIEMRKEHLIATRQQEVAEQRELQREDY